MVGVWTRINTVLLLLVLFALLAVIGLLASGARGGSLDPAAGPGSTMKTLSEVEPRIAVQSLAGNASSNHLITASGSYYLTGNITGVAGRDGIRIAANNFTIDLNGFIMDGASLGTIGINAPAAQTDIVIRNGTLRGWNSLGIDTSGLSTRWLIESVQVRNNGSVGIRLGDTSIVRNCSVNFNTAGGISAGLYSLIEGCHLTNNGSTGISTADRSTVRNNVVLRSNGDGIGVMGNSTIIDNVASNNGLGDGAGIHVFGTSNRIEHNEVSGNDRGIDVDANLNFVIRNVASLNPTQYDIVAGNTVGPIVSSATIGSATSPFANLIP